MTEQRRILIVDDDPAVGTMLGRALSRHGFRIDPASSSAQALELAAATAYDAAVLDLVMPGQDGMALATELRGRIPGLAIALLTGYVHSPLLAAAQKAGVKVFTKPVTVHNLVDFLREELGETAG